MPKTGLVLSNYAALRSRMKPGDVIAFSGHGFPSDQIKFVTKSPISHVGLVIQSKLLLNGRPQPGMLNQLAESTSLNGFTGVTISRMSDRVAAYNGNVYLLQLDTARRKKGDGVKLVNYLLRQDHKSYAYEPVAQFMLSRLPGIGKLFVSHASLQNHLFCSQYATAGLVEGEYIPAINEKGSVVDPSNTDPQDLCEMKIYRPTYYQIKGTLSTGPNAIKYGGSDLGKQIPLEIPFFNSALVGDEPDAAEEATDEAEAEAEDLAPVQEAA